MQVISLCSQKGGSGKTTLTGHLAVQATLQGHGPVALIDCDPQGSLAAWWNSREAAQPAFLETTLATLGADLERLREQGFRYVFIDTPPVVSMPIQWVMEQSDLVVILTRPSPHDLRAVRATLDLAERAGKPLIFVVNGAASRGSRRTRRWRCRSTGPWRRASSATGSFSPRR
jgi:chromosome partitioning protein